jgi:type VI secretion system protein VasI
MSDKAEAEACAEKLATETWNVVVDVDKLDGTKRISTIIMSPDKVAISSKRQDWAALGIRCSANKTELRVLWPKFLGLRPIQVKWRIDDGPIVTERWNVSSDGTLAFANNPIDMSKKMFGKKELVTNIEAYGESGTTVSFRLSGLEEAIKPIREACRW